MPTTEFELLNPEDIEKASFLFDCLKKLRLKLKNGKEEILESAFETHVHSVFEKLESRLLHIQDSNQQKLEIILARHGLYDAAFKQVILLCECITPALGDCVKDLRGVHSSLLSEIRQISFNMFQEKQQLKDELNQEHQKSLDIQVNLEKLKDSITRLNMEADERNKTIFELKSQLRFVNQEIKKVQEDPNNIKGNPLFTTSSDRNSGGSNLFVQSTSLKDIENISISSSNIQSSPRYMKSKSSSNFQNSVTEEVIQRTSSSIISSSSKPKFGPNLNITKPVQWLHNYRKDIQTFIDNNLCRNITLNECIDIINDVFESKFKSNERALQGIPNCPLETLEQHLFRILENKYGLRTLAVEHAGNLLNAIEIYSKSNNEVFIFQKIFRNEIEEEFRFVQLDLIQSIHELVLVNLKNKFIKKDQNNLQKILQEKLSSGWIYEEEWKDIISFLYNEQDASKLHDNLIKLAQNEVEDNKEIIAASKSNTITCNLPHQFSPGHHHKITKANMNYIISSITPNTSHSSEIYSSPTVLSYDTENIKDVKRLGYLSSTLQSKISKDVNKLRSSEIQKRSNRKDGYKLIFPKFIKAVLDFQLINHVEYLVPFRTIFNQFDLNNDGVLSSIEFVSFFSSLQNQMYFRDITQGITHKDIFTDENIKIEIMKSLDPFNSDRFIFSNCVKIIQKVQEYYVLF